MTTNDSGDYWFAPKRFGYGSGLPIAWQGWALLGAYAAVVALATLLIFRTILGYCAIVAVATAALMLVARTKTRGGWRWRWGGED